VWRQKVACCAGIAVCLLASQSHAPAAENFTVKTFVPTFTGATSLGANVSTILALRLWTTLRPRPDPNPDNLYFGVGQIEWSRRSLEETPEAAMRAAAETGSQLALWGTVQEYGPGVVVASNLVIPPEAAATAPRRWIVTARSGRLELGLPNVSYQFSPMIISNDVLAKYSRPNQIRLCKTKRLDCDGAALGNPFRAIRLEGDFILARQPSGATGWVWLPNLSQAQGEVVDFTAALISYLRGDFEQAEAYFAKVRDSKAESLVRNDSALLAAISGFRRGQGIEALRAAHAKNPYSRFAVQALVMADIATAIAPNQDAGKQAHLQEARQLVESYRHLFASGDAWLLAADRSLRGLN
jgi:hypothetical protein